MKLNDRVDTIEKTLVKHIEESGEIRADLKWLKKVIWFIFTSPFLIEAVKHVHIGAAK